jgi:hypothetical protein
MKILSILIILSIIIFAYACNNDEKDLFDGNFKTNQSINPQLVSDTLLPCIIGHYQQLNPSDSIIAVTSQVVHEFEETGEYYFYVFLTLESGKNIESATKFIFNGSFGATTTYECENINDCPCGLRMKIPVDCRCTNGANYQCNTKIVGDITNPINFNFGLQLIENINIINVSFIFHPFNPTSSLKMNIYGFTELELIDRFDSLFYEIIGHRSLTDSITSVMYRQLKITSDSLVHFGIKFQINNNVIIDVIGEIEASGSTSKITCHTTGDCIYTCKVRWNMLDEYDYCVCNILENGSAGCSVTVSNFDWPIDALNNFEQGVSHLQYLALPNIGFHDYR